MLCVVYTQCIFELNLNNRITYSKQIIYIQALVGNRYGYRPFPSCIDAQEFETLVKVAEKMKHNGCSTVKEWFQRNDNVVPAAYELQVNIT